MKIPRYARYAYCYQRACEFLEEFEIQSFPINFENIILQNHWGLISYSELMEQFNCDRATVIRCLGSSDGFTSWDGNNYTIAYNDDPLLGDRTRFTLVHEIGHIYLKHLIDFEATQIYRGSLSKSENRILENEANSFARNVLVPISMYLTLKDRSATNVSFTFGITVSAAEARIDFVNRDIIAIKNLKLVKRVMAIYRKFMSKQKCQICAGQFFEHYQYCPICGNKNTLQWGDGEMIYPKLETHDNGKLKECPECENEETLIEGEYCQICGRSLINHCSNYECTNTNPLPSNARYCPICGSNSTFYNAGFLKEWNYKEPVPYRLPFDSIDEELPFN